MKHELMQIGNLLITHSDIEKRDFAERKGSVRPGLT